MDRSYYFKDAFMAICGKVVKESVNYDEKISIIFYQKNY